ncbi:N-acetylmuramoyl-L-alanine amidase [Niallia sp. XMNu-256]|uniref:N-acetylmuramoyl-L-alanine amidase family protein n=1 Tax=Niallia sp. XMNu-256 TaxID=3082444 RepID=UPI0030CBA60E
MKRLSIFVVIIACIISFIVLRLDSQTEIGIINSLSSNKVEKNVREKSMVATELTEEQEERENTVMIEKRSEEKTDETPPATEITEPFLVVIDPGHQAKANLEQEPIGPDARETKYKVTGGTTGVATGKPEYVLALEAAHLLKAQLEKKGFQVILTRSSHDVDISNRERAEIANKHEADLFVRLHADGSESAEMNGFSVLVPGKDNPYTVAIYDDSYMAAQTVLSLMSKEVKIYQNGLYFRNDLSGFNWSKVPVILTEIGFMTNPEEDKKLSNEDYLTHLIKQLAAGIEAYAKTKHGDGSHVSFAFSTIGLVFCFSSCLFNSHCSLFLYIFYKKVAGI